MAVSIERIVEDLELGEGPHWDIETQSLYFVNIFGQTIHRYVPATKMHTKAHLDEHVNFIVPVEGEQNKFIVGLGSDIAMVVWDGKSENVQEVKKLAELDNPESETIKIMVNDGKCDITGRLWTGTIGMEKIDNKVKSNMGSIYSYCKSTLRKHCDQISLSNGLAWSKDNKKFFYIDTEKKTIDQFDFDLITGEIRNRKVLFSLEKHEIEGYADGMTIDEDDNLWVAIFDGYSVLKIDSKIPETLLDQIRLPARQVTSAAWGGQNLDELYVTTAKYTTDGTVLTSPDHGTLYKISGLGTKGLPMTNFKSR